MGLRNFWRLNDGTIVTDSSLEAAARVFGNFDLLNAVNDLNYKKIEELVPTIDEYLGDSNTVNIDTLLAYATKSQAVLVVYNRNGCTLKEASDIVDKYIAAYIQDSNHKDDPIYKKYYPFSKYRDMEV